jgi:hypothetical protein
MDEFFRFVSSPRRILFGFRNHGENVPQIEIGPGGKRREFGCAAFDSVAKLSSWRPPATRLVTFGKVLSSITTAQAPARSYRRWYE